MTDDLDFLDDVVPLSLAALAAQAGFEVPDGADADRRLVRAAALETAGPAELTVFAEDADLDDLVATRAAACLVPARLVAHVPPHTVALACEHPEACFRRAVAVLHPRHGQAAPAAPPAIDARACIHPRALLEQHVVVGPFAVVGAGAEIGSGTTIGASCVIGPGVRVGRGCTIAPHVDVANALLGDRVAVGPGARVGVAGPGGTVRPLGRVIVQDAVEIGANAIVERGPLRDTVIGDGAVVAPLALVRAGTTIGRGDRAGFSNPAEMV